MNTKAILAFSECMNKEAGTPTSAVFSSIAGGAFANPKGTWDKAKGAIMDAGGIARNFGSSADSAAGDQGRAPEQSVMDDPNKPGRTLKTGPSLKSSRDYASQLQNSPEVQKARQSGNVFNDAYTAAKNKITGSEDESIRQRNVTNAYAKDIQGEGIDQFNAKDRAAKLQLAYDAEKAGGNLNAMNPSTSLNKGKGIVQGQVDKQVNKGMTDVLQKTTDAYNKHMSDAVQKWGPWVMGLGLGGLGLYMALNQHGQQAQQNNVAQAPKPSWAADENWKGPGVADA